MIQNVKIPGIKALKETTLLGLGKINVICGKNNSGKTTLLEGLHASRIIGMPLDESAQRVIFQQLASLTTRYHSHTRETIEQRILRALYEAAQAHDLWFANERDSYVQSAFKTIDISEATHGLKAGWEQLFKDEPSILLPAKRELELIQQVNSDQELLPSGKGILNALFFRKNQDTVSELNKNYQEMSKAFTEVSSGYTFDVFFVRTNQVSLRFSYNDQSFIDAKDCGLGLQDLLVMLFFAMHPDYRTLMIEEPESHLHPEIQKKLLFFLRNSTDKQVFLTTHSNVFLNNAFVDRVLFTSFDNSVVIDDATSRASILDDLGYSVTDNLVSDIVILVEGPSDVPVVEEFLIKLGLYESYDTKLWPLGGDIMDQLDLSVLAQSYSLIALLDNDPGSDRIRKRFIENCEANGIPVFRLQRYSIENYFPLRVLKEEFGSQIPSHVSEIRPEIKLEDQIGLSVKKSNRKLAKSMTLDEIKGTDLEVFFTRVRTLLQDT